MKVKVTYWRGTTQYTGYATTYRGAKRIASRTQNAYGPRYEDADGKELMDDGNGLIYTEQTPDGEWLYW